MRAVSTCCYLIKYTGKDLLTFHTTYNKLNKFYIDSINLKMSNITKDICIKNHIYYFFNDMINIKDFDPNNIEIGESYTKIFLFTILDMWRSKKT